jgi:hypothetical protein
MENQMAMKNLFEGWCFRQIVSPSGERQLPWVRYGKIIGSPEPGWYAIRYFRNDSIRFYEGNISLVRVVDMADWLFFADDDELNRHIRLS